MILVIHVLRIGSTVSRQETHQEMR